jgi:recombination protein RecR
MAAGDPLADLVAALQRLPGIGARSAQRLAYHILKTPREEIDGLTAAMRSVKDKVTYCSICSNMTEADPCVYCTSSERDSRVICVVEQPENVGAIEKTHGFKGRYHVLMGTIAPLQGIGPDDLKIKGLLARVGQGGVEEIILATNPTVEGEATALYLARLLKPLGVRATRIAMGVPVGGDLDYTDAFTMSKALEGRREM